MGGSIRIISKYNGEIHKHTRWTNPLPEFVVSDKFIERDEKWIKDYLDNYKTSGYKSAVETFSPCGYGLDVFDFDNKIILSNQGYCSYNYIDYSAIFLYVNNCVVTDRDKNDIAPIKTKRMYDKKQISLYTSKNNCIVDTKNYEDAWKKMESFSKQKKLYSYFKVNWEDFGWQYIRYNESIDSFLDMFDYCMKNYPLDINDINEWIDFLTERNDEEEIDFNYLKERYVKYFREQKLERIIK